MKRVLLKEICLQLPGTNMYGHTCFRTLANLEGGLFLAVHIAHRIWPLTLAYLPYHLHFPHTRSQISCGK